MIATETTMFSGNKLKIKFSCRRVEAEVEKVVESDDGKVPCDVGSAKGLSSAAESSLSGNKKRVAPVDMDGLGVKKLKMDRKLKSQCSSILNTLIAHKDSWAFRTPVDPVELQIPDYFDVISSPMDLGTIKSKLDRNLYIGAEEFGSDVRMTFSNAMRYNPPGNPFHQMAKDLNAKFEMKWSLLDVKLSRGKSKVDEWGNTCEQIKRISQITDGKFNSSENGGVAFGSSDGEGKLAKKVKFSTPKVLGKNFGRGLESVSRPSLGSKSAKQLPSLVGRQCRKCGHITCSCSQHTDNPSSSDISPERSAGKQQVNHSSSSNVPESDGPAKTSSTSHMSKSDPESDGAVSALDEESVCPSSHHTTPVRDAASVEDWSTPIFSVPLSPNKALRAARLKSRFADTILKAQQKSLLDQGTRSDPLRMQQEKERLERKQREDKARIEAEMKAAEAAARKQTELKMKERQEREREEARIALEKVERTVVFEQNCSILEELKKLAGYHSGTWGSHFRSPLERLGLFFKDEHIVEVDETDARDEHTEEVDETDARDEHTEEVDEKDAREEQTVEVDESDAREETTVEVDKMDAREEQTVEVDEMDSREDGEEGEIY